jgi:hypothetical protein
VHDEQDNSDDEQHPGYLRRNSGNPVCAQRAGDKPENQKNEGVIQHYFLLALHRALVQRTPFSTIDAERIAITTVCTSTGDVPRIASKCGAITLDTAGSDIAAVVDFGYFVKRTTKACDFGSPFGTPLVFRCSQCALASA